MGAGTSLPSDDKLRRVIKIFLRNRRNRAQTMEEQLRAAFARFDLNGDGFVDSAELVDLLALMGKPTSEGNVRALVDRIDSSGDGLLSVDEFLSWMSEGGGGEKGKGSSKVHCAPSSPAPLPSSSQRRPRAKTTVEAAREDEVGARAAAAIVVAILFLRAYAEDARRLRYVAARRERIHQLLL